MLKLIKNYLWPFFLILFLIGSGFFVYGIIQSFQVVSGGVSAEDEGANGISTDLPDDVPDGIDEEGNGDPSEPDREDSDSLRFISLGDSLGRGTGDEEGLGFSGRTVQLLTENLDEEILYSNFAVDGFRSQQLGELLENSEFLQEIRNADGVFLSIGGNDLRTLQNLSSEDQDDAYDMIEDVYLETLEETFTLLRSENPDVLIVFLGLYHLDYSDENSNETEFLLRWNATTGRFVSSRENAVWIPTYDLFQFQLEDLLSFDGLHPNSRGYQKIAERIFDVISPFYQ